MLGRLYTIDENAGLYYCSISNFRTNGAITVSVPSAAARDSAGNLSPPGSITVVRRNVRQLPPVLESTSGLYLDAKDTSTTIIISFPEFVYLNESSLSVVFPAGPTAPKSGVWEFGHLLMVDESAGRYAVQISNMVGEGSVELLVSGDSTTDLAGNSIPSAAIKLVKDSLVPVAKLTVEGSPGSIIKLDRFRVLCEFGEYVQFDPSFVSASFRGSASGQLGDWQILDAENGSFAIEVTQLRGIGDFTIFLQTGAAVDRSGNKSPTASLTVTRGIPPFCLHATLPQTWCRLAFPELQCVSFIASAC